MENKHWPINIRQLAADRFQCDRCRDSENIYKCQNCGVGTSNFVETNLLTIYANLLKENKGYPVTLIENVECPRVKAAFDSVHDKATTDDTFKQIQNGCKNEPVSYYGKKNNNGEAEIYGVYDLTWYYSDGNHGICNEERKDLNFVCSCIQSDLRAASDIIRYCNKDSSKNELFEGGSDSKCKRYYLLKNEINIPAYAYRCYNKGYYEVAYPIIIDDFCVAVMIFGQIKSDNSTEGENMHLSEADNSLENNEKIKDCLKETSIYVDEYIKKMQNREGIRKGDFLCSYLMLLFKIIDENKSESVEDISRKIYSKIFDDFDIKNLDVFIYSNDFEENCRSLDNCEFSKGKVLNKKQIEEIQDVSESPDEIKNIISGKNIPNTDVYYKESKVSDKTYFILVYVEWKNKNDDRVSTVFDSVNNNLLSLLMTDIAKIKQETQEGFIEIFSHELNQKLMVLRSHSNILTDKLKSIESYKSLFDYKYMSIKYILDYIKDVLNFGNQVEHFVKETEDDVLLFPQKTEKSKFLPYSSFIFNLREYYDNEEKFANRKLVLPNVTMMVEQGYRHLYPLMDADEVQIGRCVSNLLSNAFKYSYAYTNIYFTCYYEKGEYHIVTINYSPQIKPEIYEHMYELGVSQSLGYSKPKGKGYGLAIIKSICDLHAGRIFTEKNDVISDYNVPLLVRLVKEVEKCGDKKQSELLKKLDLTESEYKNYKEEYDKLCGIQCNDDLNVMNFSGKKSLIDEIYYDIPFEPLKKGEIDWFLNTKTAIIKIHMIIPQ